MQAQSKKQSMCQLRFADRWASKMVFIGEVGDCPDGKAGSG